MSAYRLRAVDGRAWATATADCEPGVWTSSPVAEAPPPANAGCPCGCPRPTAESKESNMRTLVVWCPDWPVTAAGFSADEPVAVLFANRVVACSAAAREGGVRRGLRRRQAEARCSGLQLVPHDPDGEARAFEPVVAAVEEFCPRLEIVRPGVCGVATRGPSRYFGGDDTLAAKVTEAVAHVGGQAGVAEGSFAAELAARAGRVIPEGQTPVFLSQIG